MQQGIDLMLFGMGTVFVFLTLLVLVTHLMSRLIGRWLPEIEPEKTARRAADEIDPHIVAVIQAAIDKHRARHRR